LAILLGQQLWTGRTGADVWFKRGLANAKKGDAAGAIADYTRAIEINPGWSQAYLSRGVARDQTGDLKGAIADYTKAIEIDFWSDSA
jgi:tetratricopeptide (TPR) repeat protein